MAVLHPLRFRPIYKDFIWGGDKIAGRFRRSDAPARCAESWEISVRPEGMSVVDDGPFAGRTLQDLIREFGADLIGRGAAADDFPLLVKIIDAREMLSVQVHPDEASAKKFGGEAKSEMWHVLQADPGAFIYCGFESAVSREMFERALREGCVESLLKKIPVAAGDDVYVPGGCVHAIGAGCLLLEIQQSSNTTYRIYDYNRAGADGKPRDLHLDRAAQVIHWNQAGAPGPEDSPYFNFEVLEMNGAGDLRMDGHSFTVLFVETGPLSVNGSNHAAGTSLLIPACLRDLSLSGNARVCRITLP